jgi:ectoine hydroxylase-related dioxygenase (phytanoyl-CoA dioxygenase family)
LFEESCVEVYCPAGSLIVFHARLFHRTNINHSDHWRHSMTLNACRSFMKQRMDWVRFVPPEISDALNDQGRRLLGFDTRLPASLEEMFVPEDQRLYKPNQG